MTEKVFSFSIRILPKVLDDTVSRDRCHRKPSWSVVRWQGTKTSHDNLQTSGIRQDTKPIIFTSKGTLAERFKLGVLLKLLILNNAVVMTRILSHGLPVETLRQSGEPGYSCHAALRA